MKSPLQIYREKHELTQQELADRLGISQSFLANIERGARRITPEKAVEWEATLGVDRADLCPEIFGVPSRIDASALQQPDAVG